jgi:hypothetical protein
MPGSASRPSQAVHAFVAAVVAGLAYALAYFPAPNPYDEFLAMPIARAMGDPGLYSAHDILVSAGVRGPFRIYHALGAVVRAGGDLDLAWYLALAGSLVLFGAAMYWMARAVAPTRAAIVATVLIACSDPGIGSVHWAWLPQRSFVSGSVAIPMVLAALGFALRRRSGIGLLIASVAFWLHPGFGLCGAIACGVLLLGEGDRWRPRLAWASAALVVGLTNVVLVRHDQPSVVRGAWDDFASQFRQFAWHAFVGDHWREGYGVFLLGIAVALMAVRARPPHERRAARLLLATLTVTSVGWIAYAQWGTAPAVLLLFLGRASAFAKVLAWTLIVAWTLQQLNLDDSARPRRRVGAVMLGVGALLSDVSFVEGWVFAGVAVLLALHASRPRYRPEIVVLVIAAMAAFAERAGLGVTVDAARGLAIAAAALVLARELARWSETPVERAAAERSEPTPRESWSLALGVCAVAVVLLTQDWHGWVPARPTRLWVRLHFSRPAGDNAALERWARDSTARGAMFLVPPVDERFVPFRVRALRSAYVHESDVNQLAYDPASYPAALRRLGQAGVRVVRRHQLDDGGYAALAPAALAAIRDEGAAYAVFDRKAPAKPFPVAWQDGHWIVYRLGDVR